MVRSPPSILNILSIFHSKGSLHAPRLCPSCQQPTLTGYRDGLLRDRRTAWWAWSVQLGWRFPAGRIGWTGGSPGGTPAGKGDDRSLQVPGGRHGRPGAGQRLHRRRRQRQEQPAGSAGRPRHRGGRRGFDLPHRSPFPSFRPSGAKRRNLSGTAPRTRHRDRKISPLRSSSNRYGRNDGKETANSARQGRSVTGLLALKEVAVFPDNRPACLTCSRIM